MALVIVFFLFVDTFPDMYGYHGNRILDFLRITMAMPRLVAPAKRLLEQGLKCGPFPMHCYQSFEANIDFEIRWGFLFFYRTFYDVKSLGVVTSSASEFRGSAFESHLFWVEFESPPPRLCGLSPVLFILMNLFFCQIHGGLQCGWMLLDRTSERPIQSP